jgi:hypothetical protein
MKTENLVKMKTPIITIVGLISLVSCSQPTVAEQEREIVEKDIQILDELLHKNDSTAQYIESDLKQNGGHLYLNTQYIILLDRYTELVQSRVRSTERLEMLNEIISNQ